MKATVSSRFRKVMGSFDSTSRKSFRVASVTLNVVFNADS